MKRVLVGVIHGGEHEDESEHGSETVVYSGDESSTGETGSLYRVQDDQVRGCSDGDSIPDPPGQINRVGIFMAGIQAANHSSTAAAMLSGSAGQEALCARRFKFYLICLMH